MTPRRILIVSDTWHPKIDGIVRVTDQLVRRLEARGHTTLVVHPGLFFTIPFPVYPELRLALFPTPRLVRMVESFAPDHIHVMTEGPLGLAMRRLCRKRGWKFTTSYHTHLQLYVHVRLQRFLGFVYGLLNWFHKAAERTMVSTQSLAAALEAHNFKNVVLCPMGVDGDVFVRQNGIARDPNQPVFVYLGRIAPEKSVHDFLKLDLPGKKVVIGDGPSRRQLEQQFPDATFVGYQQGSQLIETLSGCDVMVFPSRTETFGLVVLEALAMGIPVAAYDVMGPRDTITHGVDGYLSHDLREAALKCLELKGDHCRQKALRYSWEATVDAFLSNLVPVSD